MHPHPNPHARRQPGRRALAGAALAAVLLAACGQKGSLYMTGRAKDTPWPMGPVPAPAPAPDSAPTSSALPAGAAAQSPAAPTGASPTAPPAAPAGAATPDAR